jgi:hypothetical protein
MRKVLVDPRGGVGCAAIICPRRRSARMPEKEKVLTANVNSA